MIIPINAGTNNQGVQIVPEPGASRVLIQNPSAVDLYFHQGFELTYGALPIGAPAAAATKTDVIEAGNGTAALAPDESVMLNFSRPVWIDTGAANASATVNVTPLA